MSARSGSGARPVPLLWAPRPGAFPGVRTLSRDGRALLLQKGALGRAPEPATPGNARTNSRIGRGELAANASPRPRAPCRYRVGGVANPGSSSPQRTSPPPQRLSPPPQGPSSPPGLPRFSKLSPNPPGSWGVGGDSPASSCRSRALSRGSGRAPILAGCRRAARYKAHGERAHGPERGGRPSSYSPNPRRPELEPRAPRTSKPSSAPPPPPPPSHAPDAPSSPPARRPAP